MPLTERSRIRVSNGALRYAEMVGRTPPSSIVLPSSGQEPLVLQVECVSNRELNASISATKGQVSEDILILDKRCWDHIRERYDETEILQSVAGVVVLREYLVPGKWPQFIPGIRRLLFDGADERPHREGCKLHFEVLPNFVSPRQLIGRDSEAGVSCELYDSPARSGLRALVRRYRLVKMLCADFESTPLYYIICKTAVGAGCDTEVRQSIRSIYISATGAMVVWVTNQDASVFCRIPLVGRARERIENHAKTLTALQRAGESTGIIPKVIRVLTTGAVSPTLIEQGLPGSNVEKEFINCELSVAKRYFAHSLDRITSLHLRAGVLRTLDATAYQQFIGAKIDEIAERLQELGLITDNLNWMNAFFREKICGSQQLVGVVHGDFKVGNCLFDETGLLTGIVDWDMSSLEDLSVFDVASLWSKSVRGRQALSLPALLRKLPSETTSFFGLTESWFDRTGSAPVDMWVLARLYWLDRVYKQLKYGSGDVKPWYNVNVQPVIGAGEW